MVVKFVQEPAQRGHDNGSLTAAVSGFSKAMLKKQVRDTERPLRREASSNTALQEKERKLKALKRQTSDVGLCREKDHLTERCRRIRFFECQKALRRIKSLLRQSDGNGETSALLNEYKKDLNYIIYFPKGQRYISLYLKVQEAKETILRRRTAIRDQINRDVEEGKAVDAWCRVERSDMFDEVGLLMTGQKTNVITAKRKTVSGFGHSSAANDDDVEEDDDDDEEEEEGDDDDEEDDEEDDGDDGEGNEGGSGSRGQGGAGAGSGDDEDDEEDDEDDEDDEDEDDEEDEDEDEDEDDDESDPEEDSGAGEEVSTEDDDDNESEEEHSAKRQKN